MAIAGIVLTVLGVFNIHPEVSADQAAEWVVSDAGVNWTAIVSFVFMAVARFVTDGAVAAKDWWKSRTIWVALATLMLSISQSFGYELHYTGDELVETIAAGDATITGINWGGLIAAVSMIIMRFITKRPVALTTASTE